MIITKTLYVKHRDQWRAWLQKHHASKREIWLVYYKKESGKQRIPYNDAVEEALCVGWIDSVVKPFDGDFRAHRFTPRKKGSVWSEPNKRRVRRLAREGRMAEAVARARQLEVGAEAHGDAAPLQASRQSTARSGS